MKDVTIRFMGPVRRPEGMGQEVRLPLQPGVTVDGLLADLGYEGRERARLRVMVDGKTLRRDDPLEGVGEITLFLPLGGG